MHTLRPVFRSSSRLLAQAAKHSPQARVGPFSRSGVARFSTAEIEMLKKLLKDAEARETQAAAPGKVFGFFWFWFFFK